MSLRGSCEKYDELPQVMSLESVSTEAKNDKLNENETNKGVWS